jgi:hypothetical protein
LTTVGFGDIGAGTTFERVLCMIWMLFGVGFYSFVVGTLSSVISSLDDKNTHTEEKLQLI